MGMIKEFKEFGMRGNVVDVAVGIIIGAAFGKIVSSLVNDVIMPPIGLLLGNLDFSQLAITLREKTPAADAISVKYGIFINTVLDFIIVAFAVFMLIRQLNRFKRKNEAPAAAPVTKECPKCFSIIPVRATRCPNCTSEFQRYTPQDIMHAGE
jgi:large conductance mechanosensitive channel